MSDSKHAQGNPLFQDNGSYNFIQAFMKRNFTSPVEIDPCRINILSSEYVKDNSKDSRATDAQITNEVVDMIVKAALHHKALDPPVESGKRLESLRESLTKTFSALAEGEDSNILNGILLKRGGDKTLGGVVVKSLRYVRDPNVNLSKLQLFFFYILSRFSDTDLNAKASKEELLKAVFTEVSAWIHGIFQGDGINIERTVNSQFVALVNGLPENLKNDASKELAIASIESIIRYLKLLINKYNANKDTLPQLKKVNNTADKKFLFSYHTTVKKSTELVVNNIMQKIKEYFLNKYTVVRKTLADPVQREFYDQTFAKWNQLDDNMKELYSSVVQILKGDDVVSSSEYGKIAEGDMKNYRINMKKREAGSNITVFGHLIPFVNKGNFTGFWFTSDGGKYEYVDHFNRNVLREIYFNIYNGKVSGNVVNVNFKNGPTVDFPASIRVLSRDHMLNYDTKALVEKGIPKCKELYETLSHSDDPVSLENVADGMYFDFPFGNIWQRDSAGNLIRIDNGSIIQYGNDGDDTALKPSKDLMADKTTCYNTYMYTTVRNLDKFDEKTDLSTEFSGLCERMSKCLLNDDSNSLNSCLDLLQDERGFQVLEAQVADIHPAVATKILDKFGFKTFEANDASFSNMRLKKYQSVDSWVDEVVKSKFSDKATQDALSGKNGSILRYLGLLVAHVNSNPAMLNDGFRRDPYKYDFNSDLGPKAPGYSKPIRSWTPEEKKDARDYLDKLRTSLHTSYHHLTSSKNPFHVTETGLEISPFQSDFFDFGELFPFSLYGTLTPSMYGGGALTEVISGRLDSGKFVGSTIYNELYQSATEMLEHNNKSLTDDQKKQISAQLEQLTKLENSIRDTVTTMEEYNKLINIFANYRDNRDLTIEKLKGLNKFYSDQLERREKAEKQMVGVIYAMQSLYVDANNGSYESA